MKHILTIGIFVLLASLCFAAWDNDKPADNRTWNLVAGDIRDNNDALEVVMGVDLLINHPYWQAAAPTKKPDGTTVLDSDDLGRLWVDSDDNILYILTATTPTWTQSSSVLTANNTWAVAQTWTLGIVANNVWVQSTDNAGTGTVDLIKADASDVVHLADDTVTNTQSASDNSTQIATTAYVDTATATSNAFLQYNYQLGSGNNGGTATSGSWIIYPLNTEIADSDTLGSIASNQVTLAAGTYDFFVTATFKSTDHTQIRLQDTTGATTIGLSIISEAAASGRPPAIIDGRFTIGAESVLEIQYRCSDTQASDGLGESAGWGTEVYGIFTLRKVGS